MFLKTICSRASAAAPRNILVGRTLTRTLTRNVLHPTTQTPFIGAVSYYSSVNEAALAERIERVLEAKRASGLTYDELAQKLSLTNTYTAQLLLGQAKLTSDTATKLQQALPGISDDDLQDMQRFFPMRSFDENLKKEPNVYRTYEAIMHNGEAIKAIINEQCGDGIMSAIDFYLDVGTTTGKHGEKRVVIMFNGKFLSFIEQSLEDNGARSPRD